MQNKKMELCPAPVLILILIIFFLFVSVDLGQAAEPYINELLDANPPIEVLKDGPIVRVKQTTAAIEEPETPSQEAMTLDEVTILEEAATLLDAVPVPRTLKKVALTFDDGPDLKNTSKILEILKAEQIQATFFVVGTQVERYPDMVKRIFNDGHLIANHSRSHMDFAELTNDEIVALELGPTSKAVEKLTGFYPMIMRPPYGSLRVDSVSFLRESGWHIVRWSLDTFDWDSSRNKPEQIVDRVLAQHHPNAIVLMHCNGPATTKALPDVIKTFRDLGYDFVTVGQL